MSGKRQKTQYTQLRPLRRKAGVNPWAPTAEGPKHSRRNKAPKVRQEKNG
jgi:hypothetical protein